MFGSLLKLSQCTCTGFAAVEEGNEERTEEGTEEVENNAGGGDLKDELKAE